MTYFGKANMQVYQFYCTKRLLVISLLIRFDSFFQEQLHLSNRMSAVEQQQAQNKKDIDELTAEATKNKREIATLFRLNDDFRKEMNELSQKVAELYVLKKQLTVCIF